MANWADLAPNQWVTEQNLNQAYTTGGFPVKNPVGTSQRFMTRTQAQDAIFLNAIAGNQNQFIIKSEMVAAPQEIAQYINIAFGIVTMQNNMDGSSTYRLTTAITDPDGTGFGDHSTTVLWDPGTVGTQTNLYKKPGDTFAAIGSMLQRFSGQPDRTYAMGNLDTSRILNDLSIGAKVRYSITLTRVSGNPPTGSGGVNRIFTYSTGGTIQDTGVAIDSTNIVTIIPNTTIPTQHLITGYFRKNTATTYDLYYKSTIT